MKRGTTTERAGKRETILAAAFERFSRYGFRRTAMEDIAQQAGISRAAIYLHFKNKEEVFRALAEQVHERALAAAARASAVGTAAERIERILEAKLGTSFDVMHGSPHARELLDENNRICGEISAASARRFGKLLTGVLRRASKRGELRPQRLGLSPPAAAELIVDSAKGLEMASAGLLSPARYRKRLAQLVRVLLTGLGADNV
jgi:AcrR family transcriptional regulator